MSDIERTNVFEETGYTSEEDAVKYHAQRHLGASSLHVRSAHGASAQRRRIGRPAMGEEGSLLGISDHSGVQNEEDKERAIKHGSIREQFVVDDIWKRLLQAEDKGDRRAVALALISFDKRYKRSIGLGREPAQPTLPGLEIK